jgi:hypothetical protein
MVEKSNITIQNKNTKLINYRLNLDEGGWYKAEFDNKYNIIYYENGAGRWTKSEYNDEGDRIYYETSNGVIRDDR